MSEGPAQDTARRPRDALGDAPQAADQPQANNSDPANTDDTAGPPKRPLLRRPLFWLILAIVTGVVIIGGVLWWLHARRFESTDDAFIDAHVVRIAPQISGQLTWIARDIDNRHVRAGELLATIAPQGPQAQLQEARAGIGEADAAIAQAQGRLISARAARGQAVADERGPVADAARAERDYERYRNLARLDPAAVAATQLDQAHTQAIATAATAAAARERIRGAEADIGVATKGIAAARAQRRSAVARVAQSRVNTGYLRIVAPIDGQVVQRNVNIGSTVSPESQMLAIVPDAIWITANFKEDQLALMRRGQPVAIHIDAFPDRDFAGHVDSIQRGAGQAFGILPPQNATGNYVKVVQRVPVRILFDRLPDTTRFPIGPGMSVVPTVTVR